LADRAVSHGVVTTTAVNALRPPVALVHDYLSERGGAERVAISLTRAFPTAPLYTSVFDRATYPELDGVDVRPSLLDRVRPLRKRHRLALPLLPAVYGRLHVDADVVICSSSGWSHGIATDAPKVVYCHNPPRWVYQRAEYSKTRKRYWLASTVLLPLLKRWDQQAAHGCDRYIANSSSVARRIEEVYGRDAEVLPPPTSLDIDGEQEPVRGLEPGFVLSISRLLAYKNVDQVTQAFAGLPNERLVVVGDGPYRPELIASAPSNVMFTGRVTDAELRWLYANCAALVSASFEDFGLTPVEAALFGKPSVLLRAGGFLDTTVEGTTGLFFEEPEPSVIRTAISETLTANWSPELIVKSAQRYSQDGFARRLREIVNDVRGYSGLY
jgi:glycosyltransferase involved in cell wall biosynthesis